MFSHLKFCLLAFLFFNSCAEKPEEVPKEKPIEVNRPKLVGRIASLPVHRKFALIQSYGTWTIVTGAILTSNGSGGREANLRVTGEKLGQFAAADVQSGDLEVGDGVYTLAEPLPPKPVAGDLLAPVD